MINFSNIPTNTVIGIYGSGNFQKQQMWEHGNSDNWFTMVKDKQENSNGSARKTTAEIPSFQDPSLLRFACFHVDETLNLLKQ